MRKDAHILIVAGDPSADRHGAELMDSLRQKHPGLRITALGGDAMKKKADAFLYPLVGLGGFGFLEPLFKLPQLWSALSQVKTLLKNDRPDVVVPIDYYGFNIHVARLAHRQGIPVAYYVSPQVWASRPGRIQQLAGAVNKMLVIFPFEVDLYQKAGVPVHFVGHPLLDRLPAPAAESTEPTIGLLPGSRRGVAARHLPILIETAERLHREFPNAQCLLFRPAEIEDDFYKPFLRQTPWIQVTADPSYEARKRLWLAIGVSGTAALENMLLGIPMIIMYKLSEITFWIAKRLIRVPFVGIPNLLAGRAIIPELLQDDATPEKLAQNAGSFLRERQKREDMRRALLALRDLLHGDNPHGAADEILEMMA